MFNYNPQPRLDGIGSYYRAVSRDLVMNYIFTPARDNIRNLLTPFCEQQAGLLGGSGEAFRFMGRTYSAEHYCPSSVEIYTGPRSRKEILPLSFKLTSQFEQLYHFILSTEQEYNRIQIYLINVIQRCATLTDFKFLLPEPVQQNWAELTEYVSNLPSPGEQTVDAALKESLDQQYQAEIALVYKYCFSRFLY